MDKRFLGILAVIIIIFIGVFALTQKSSSNGSSGSGGNSPQTTKHITGEGAKGVTLVEWGDYECPICGAYYQPVKQVVDQYKSDIFFQFKNLPLTSIHQNAFAAARAAEAAGLQNKYWQMHDKLYETQNAWSSSSDPLSTFTSYAQQLGLNVNQFKADYASSKVNDAINADLAAFKKTGQDQATPTFFLNGKYVPNTTFSDPQTGEPSVTKMSQAIQAEINKQASSSSQNQSSAPSQ
jgi:protein-disulfide isomerase